VHATTDPLRAFELLACHEVAVVLCDQRMPAMTGIEFVTRVKSMVPETIRIMPSAYDDCGVTRQAINMGAVYRFIEKSSSHEEVRHAVEDAFRLYLSRRVLEQAWPVLACAVRGRQRCTWRRPLRFARVILKA
jgi:DNA-binding NarL/FixJ family response regulator